MPSNPPADPAAHLYRGDAGREYHHGKRGLDPRARVWVEQARAEKFRPWVRESDTVVEFGVGAGWNLARLSCARKVGCDASGFLAAEVRSQGIEFTEDLETLAAEVADVLICHHALEHVLEPAVTLRSFARVLKRGGLLVVHVPWEVERRYARFDPAEPNHHLYHWNAQNLGNLVTVLGWRVESVGTRRYGYDRFAANLALRLRLGGTGFRLLRGAMVRLRPLREVELVARRVEGVEK